ncbi:IclR family transcriptional regulator [Microbacterium album]|uniref:IclR-family regulatory protein n=1 Tax=Microbacterium album TaxID=2053191 RepID=A0A917ML25_9MICO|nr:IclR family transcriptional regulator [Microbacterium album]GGH39851.1 putative IclR-family regulatory protein [Microbacterium album]
MDAPLVTGTNPTPPGTQAVSRAALLLRLVTGQGEEGATFAHLVSASGLTRPTAHRLLSALRAEGMVDRDAVTSRWLPGPELYLMGSVAAARYDVASRSRDVVRSLAAATEESAFLSVRRGDETVCLVREDGAFPIRSFVLYEGVRFPLGVASAGLAILAFLPEDEIAAYLERHGELPKRWGEAHSAAQLRRRIAQTQDRGYSVNPGLIVEGSWGMGAAVFDRAGRPAWALSVTGVEFRFGPERRARLGRALLAHAHELTGRLKAVAG